MPQLHSYDGMLTALLSPLHYFLVALAESVWRHAVGLCEYIIEIAHAAEPAFAAYLLYRHVGHDKLAGGILHPHLIDKRHERSAATASHHAAHIVAVVSGELHKAFTSAAEVFRPAEELHGVGQPLRCKVVACARRFASHGAEYVRHQTVELHDCAVALHHLLHACGDVCQCLVGQTEPAGQRFGRPEQRAATLEVAPAVVVERGAVEGHIHNSERAVHRCEGVHVLRPHHHEVATLQLHPVSVDVVYARAALHPERFGVVVGVHGQVARRRYVDAGYVEGFLRTDEVRQTELCCLLLFHVLIVRLSRDGACPAGALCRNNATFIPKTAKKHTSSSNNYNYFCKVIKSVANLQSKHR